MSAASLHETLAPEMITLSSYSMDIRSYGCLCRTCQTLAFESESMISSSEENQAGRNVTTLVIPSSYLLNRLAPITPLLAKVQPALFC